MSRQHELKTIIDKIINEFQLKVDDRHNIYSLLQELKNSGLLTQTKFKKIVETVTKNSINLKYEEEPCLVLNDNFEIIFGNEPFYQLIGIEVNNNDTNLFNEGELAKLKKAVKLVKETNQEVKCSLKISTLTKKAHAVIMPNTIEGHYYVIFKM
ncbi:hypothetical protein RJD24_12065 [Bacillaceae bacterium IKA-2]|nr:hypothetical protein RJD24_12065 [Bacillaceae bacterium IKA-2]